jgi:hypothetical protein
MIWILDVNGAVAFIDVMYRPDTPAVLLLCAPGVALG